jgi:hypothetical protein
MKQLYPVAWAKFFNAEFKILYSTEYKMKRIEEFYTIEYNAM